MDIAQYYKVCLLSAYESIQRFRYHPIGYLNNALASHVWLITEPDGRTYWKYFDE